jgi:hypothetical protein
MAALAGIPPGPEVVVARFGVSFFAGEVVDSMHKARSAIVDKRSLHRRGGNRSVLF